MTTNVRDSFKGVLASDSRWTWSAVVDGQQIQTHLDDTGYEKIIAAHSHVFMFAGDAVVIDEWKKAIKSASYTASQPQWGNLPVNGMAISVVQSPSGDVLFESGHDITVSGISFAGTGSYAAARCWRQNLCAVKAVESAKSSDKFTGGTVRFKNVLTDEGNLVMDSDLDSLAKQFFGSATMTLNNVTQTNVFGDVVQANNVAANDEALRKALRESFAAGQGPTAPCDAVFHVWPSEEKAKLVQAMEKVFSE